MKSSPRQKIQVHSLPRRHRRGGALVELAVCLPVICLLVLGSIEAAHAVFLKQALVTAAYEAARDCTGRTSTQASATAKAVTILEARNVRNATINFSPANVELLTRGESFTVTVAAPYQSNLPLPAHFFTASQLSVQTTMVREALP